MLHALHIGWEKLSVYYTKTKEIHGNFYAIGTILAPEHKLQFFSCQDWSEDPQWRDKYRETLYSFLEPYQ